MVLYTVERVVCDVGGVGAARAAGEAGARDVRDGAGVPAGPGRGPAHRQPQRGRAPLHLRRQLPLRAQPALPA